MGPSPVSPCRMSPPRLWTVSLPSVQPEDVHPPPRQLDLVVIVVVVLPVVATKDVDHTEAMPGRGRQANDALMGEGYLARPWRALVEPHDMRAGRQTLQRPHDATSDRQRRAILHRVVFTVWRVTHGEVIPIERNARAGFSVDAIGRLQLGTNVQRVSGQD